MNAKTRDEVIRWINGKRDFNAGMELLEREGFKPGVIRVLKKQGKNGPEVAERLLYQMRDFLKANGVAEDTDPVLHVYEGKPAKTEIVEKKKVGIIKFDNLIKSKDETVAETPENVRRLVHKYSKLYKDRDKAFNKMKALPENNDEKTVKQRLALKSEIEECTDEMERLYPLYEQYFDKGEVPNEEDINPTVEVKEDDDDGEDFSVHAGLTKKEAQKIKKSIKTKIIRANNMLEYRSESKKDKERNPMPEGPQRVKYETKVANLQKALEKVEYYIASFG